ncbi:hypothetical protein BK717_09355 [Bacillus thuringiensis serovar malayensis]|uniref:Vip1Aa2-like protein n=1 Tax=Bacillus thuringiensis TaxID=1428 RepID=A0A6F7TLQ8_BACTU|nr:binary toxin-like calcium binding domain-containing protein [Bacillus toyonensis]AEH76832.1 Vip1Aa2-like protein [Bacillus thuringiensis]AHK06513.1 vegetative insecticidal protein cry3295 [Bacillus thuringiensis]MEC2394892.1 hypothetical protein [Bacillus toyonensis]OTX38304.1 hypothetical protein BK717_09355 [Bacillus thuringiensis serovar malayensis]
MTQLTGSIRFYVVPQSFSFIPEITVNDVAYQLHFGETCTINGVPIGSPLLQAKSIIIANYKYVATFSPATVEIKPDTISRVMISFNRFEITDDTDGEGVPNELEMNGYGWNPETSEFEYYDPIKHIEKFRTNPLVRSTCGDPYTDSRKASKKNLSHVRPPYNHPWVAAYPIIKAILIDYTITPKAEIIDSQGNRRSTCFTNRVTQSDVQPQGKDFENSIELCFSKTNPQIRTSLTIGELNSYAWETESVRHINFEERFNWKTANTINKEKAASISFNIQFLNEGALYATNIIPTFNILIGGQVIQRHTISNPIPSLDVGAHSHLFKVGNGDDISLTLEQLRAIQLGAPITLEVLQVNAEIREFEEKNNSWKIIAQWPELEVYDINQKTAVFVYIDRNGKKTEYRVAARPIVPGLYDLKTTLGDILQIVLRDQIQKTSEGIYINGFKLDNNWIYYSNHVDRIHNFIDEIGPGGYFLNLPVYIDDIILLKEPSGKKEPRILFAEFTKDYKKIKASIVPGLYGIRSIEAEIRMNNVIQKVPLIALSKGAYCFETDLLVDSADINFLGTLYVYDYQATIYQQEITTSLEKEGYVYQPLTFPQVLLDGTLQSVSRVSTLNQRKGSINLNVDKLAVKGKSYIFQVESHRWSSPEIKVTIGNQIVQLGCDDYRPNRYEMQFQFSDGRPSATHFFEGCRMYEFPILPTDIPGKKIKKIKQVNTPEFIGNDFNGAQMTVLRRLNANTDKGLHHTKMSVNGNIIFENFNGKDVSEEILSFTTCGVTKMKERHNEDVRIRIHGNNGTIYDFDATKYFCDSTIINNFEDGITFIELIGERPILLRVDQNLGLDRKQKYLFMDPYYNKKYNLKDWGLLNQDIKRERVSISGWPVCDFPYLQRGAISSPVVSRTIIVTFPDDTVDVPIEWEIGREKNDYARITRNSETQRTEQINAFLKVKLLGAFTDDETSGRKFTELGHLNNQPVIIPITSDQLIHNTCIPLPNEHAEAYLIRIESKGISSDEIKVMMGHEFECYLGSSDYNMNKDTVEEKSELESPLRSELLFIPVSKNSNQLNILIQLSSFSQVALDGGEIRIYFLGYFSHTSKLKFIPYSLQTIQDQFIINHVPYHNIKAHLMQFTVNGGYDHNTNILMNSDEYHINRTYIGISDGTQLKKEVKPEYCIYSGLGYGISSPEQRNKVSLSVEGTNIPYINTNYIGYFH